MDYPYIILMLFLFVLLGADLYKPNKIYSYLAPISVLLFIGLRAPVVGGDTIDYVRLFEGSKAGVYTYYTHVELLYRTYSTFMGTVLMTNGVLFLITHTFLSLFPFYLLMRKCSRNIPFSCLLFMIMMLYVHYMSALRQILGMGILFLGMWYFIEEKKYKWYIFIGSGVLGFFMHSSVLITFFGYLICYFVRYRTKMVPYISILVSALVGRVFHWLNIQSILKLIASNQISELERMNTYLGWSLSDDDNASLLRLLSSSIIALAFFYMMTTKQATHWFSKIFLLGIIINNLFYEVRMLDRLILPFMLFATICYTWMFNIKYRLSKKRLKIVYQSMLIISLVYLTQSYVKQNTNYDSFGALLLHPYYFFWQDYSDHPTYKVR